MGGNNIKDKFKTQKQVVAMPGRGTADTYCPQYSTKIKFLKS